MQYAVPYSVHCLYCFLYLNKFYFKRHNSRQSTLCISICIRFLVRSSISRLRSILSLLTYFEVRVKRLFIVSQENAFEGIHSFERIHRHWFKTSSREHQVRFRLSSKTSSTSCQHQSRSKSQHGTASATLLTLMCTSFELTLQSRSSSMLSMKPKWEVASLKPITTLLSRQFNWFRRHRKEESFQGQRRTDRNLRPRSIIASRHQCHSKDRQRRFPVGKGSPSN